MGALVKQCTHHTVSAQRDPPDTAAFPRLVLSRRQSEHGADSFGVAETGGNINGGAKSKCGHCANARNTHETPANFVFPDNRQQLPMQFGKLLTQLPPGF